MKWGITDILAVPYLIGHMLEHQVHGLTKGLADKY